MNLLVNFFKSNNDERNQEYLFALDRNIDNEYIDTIFLFVEDISHVEGIESEKVKIVELDSRPTFQDIIDFGNKELKGQQCIISNTDIFMDDTLSHVKDNDISNLFLSLTRWDVKTDGTIEYYDVENKGWTQDTYIYESPIDIKDANFFVGLPGQENRLAYLAYEAGLNVINPSLLVIIKHFHLTDYTSDSNSRHSENRVQGKYLYVKTSKTFEPPPHYDTVMCQESDDGELEWIKDRIVPNYKSGVHTQNKKHSGVLVTGGTGLVGNAVRRLVQEKNDSPFFSIDANFLSSSDCDLRDWNKVNQLFGDEMPEVVIHLAGKVGGVKANSDQVADFYTDNIMMNTNVLHAAHKHDIPKLINMLSSCIYPDKVKYPIKEKSLHDGPPHDSNFGYAYAKRMLEVQSRAYSQQYFKNFISVIPNNIFGEHDNFHRNDSHVIPAIIRKMYEAKNRCSDVKLWGDGTPLRQFTYSYDIANILFYIVNNYNSNEPINIGCSDEISISEAAQVIAEAIGFEGNIIWRTDMPSGQHRKPCDYKKLKSIGWKTFTPFKEAIKNTCDWYMKNYPNVRGI